MPVSLQTPVVSYIGLGSNLSNKLGDSQAILRDAVQALAHYGDVQVSGLYASKPLGPQDQPDFVNAAASLRTTLPPLALLDVLQQLENAAGRVKLRHWGERTLDLDLLLYADQTIESPRLTVPHAGILQRHFVMLPLLDLNPQLQVAGHFLQHQLDSLPQDDIRKLAGAEWLQQPGSPDASLEKITHLDG